MYKVDNIFNENLYLCMYLTSSWKSPRILQLVILDEFSGKNIKILHVHFVSASESR